MKAIMLVLTERCNLACRYCYECGEAHAMTFDRCREVIDREMEANAGERFKIFFFGGEPFVRFDVMRQVFAYAESRYGDRVASYAVTTNGTLVHGELQAWLEQRKDRFEITLSLDGTQEMHDRSRTQKDGRGSYAMIDLPFFQQIWPGCIVKMTISPETIADFPRGIYSIEGLGFRCKANFASGVDFQLEKNRITILRNFKELAAYYSENDLPLCYMLDLPLQAILKPLDDRFRYCVAGLDRHCYSDESSWYPCQGLMPMSITGRERFFREETFTGSSVLCDSSCALCPFVRICRTCYAMNYHATGNVYQPDEQICLLNKICMITSARIQYSRLKKRGTQDPQLERAVYLIASGLNHLFSDLT